MPSTPVTADEMAVLARQADLHLPEHVKDELISAWEQIAPMIARIHRSRPYGDEPAHVFNPVVFDLKA